MVAASLGAHVTIVERAGLGGSAVLTDVVPSKTLIATADLMTRVGEADELGVKFDGDGTASKPRADLKHINDRVLTLAHGQSDDIRAGLERLGVEIVIGSGKLLDNNTIEVLTLEGTRTIDATRSCWLLVLTRVNFPRQSPTANASSTGPRSITWTSFPKNSLLWVRALLAPSSHPPTTVWAPRSL